MRGPAMRWIGRSRPRFPIWQAQARKPCQHPWNIILTLTPLTRSISSQPQSHLSGTTATTTTTTTSSKESKSRKWTVFFSNAAVAGGLAFVAAALLTNRSSSDSDRAALNKSTFVPFAITSKEQVSPSAFILTVRPSNDHHRDGGGAATSSSSSSSSAAPIPSAWQHGLWSVEIKQPQLQIARHYTPLPPAPSSEREGSREEEEEGGGGGGGGGGRESELRFLIRRMDGGEMSTYLSKRAVGDVIWLRGPHLGFDIARRLGSSSSSNSGSESELGNGGGGGHVVFLAGGTGVAPALQIARRLLDSNSNSNSSDDHDHNHNPATTLTILWANRLAADAQGRPSPSPSPGPAPGQLRIPFWSTPPHNHHHHHHVPQQPQPSPPSSSPSSLARQIQALRQRHPARFRISYYVDEEGTFIGPRDLASSLPPHPHPHYPHPNPNPDPDPDPDPSCPWHSAAAIESLSDDADADADAGACACPGPGPRAQSLLCVSGPDGFVEAYAGPKRWRDGRETQGAVGGLLGRMMTTTTMMRDWIVLKL
ncbi:hypothetical protein F4809DRAFT_614573 [Biscogniauxia mediterranea]|nr:hypothetical protein F4809DRAFT_614573 [Biscogniauxia mediterranea]